MSANSSVWTTYARARERMSRQIGEDGAFDSRHAPAGLTPEPGILDDRPPQERTDHSRDRSPSGSSPTASTAP